jgi:uroporphyrinogen decarboxylase
LENIFLKALAGEEVERSPVWLMRQAGRYLPEYQKIRSNFSLMEMFHNPQIAAEVTCQPIERFGLDAAIVFADILLIVESFGVDLSFKEGVGPCFSKSFKQISGRYKSPRETLSYVGDTIEIVKKKIETPLIGFAGAPFTVASYLMEGDQRSKEIELTRAQLYKYPQEVLAFMEKLTEATIEYLKMQVERGVDAIQLFESFGHKLSPKLFETFSYPFLKKIVDALKSLVPVIVFSRGTQQHSSQLLDLGATALSVDWQSDLQALHQKAPMSTVLQGNLDPCVLFSSPEVIFREVKSMLEKVDYKKGFIANLGHGVLPKTPPEHVQAFVEAIRSFSRSPAGV